MLAKGRELLPAARKGEASAAPVTGNRILLSLARGKKVRSGTELYLAHLQKKKGVRAGTREGGGVRIHGAKAQALNSGGKKMRERTRGQGKEKPRNVSKRGVFYRRKGVPTRRLTRRERKSCLLK